MVVGSTVYSAACKLRKTIEEAAGRPIAGSKSFEQVASKYLMEHGPLRVVEVFTLPDTVKWDQATFRGDAYPAFSWGCNVVELEVDPQTLEIKVKKVTACFDVGRVINPTLATGQIEGGLTQALGYAVMEKVGIKDGKFDANRMQTYVIPTALDVPEYDVTFVEYPYEFAAPGAKGVGEMPMDGLAPAIANAIEQATGLRMTDLPITPEKLFSEIRGQRSEVRS
jgi:CO/xanthine dehydrogenase Mo-binding subunit